MPKMLTIVSMVIAALLLLIFGLDLAAGIPFRRASIVMDAGFVVCALAVAYLGFSAYRELK